MRRRIVREVCHNLDQLSGSRRYRQAKRPQKTKAVKTALCRAARTALQYTRGVFICANGVEERYVAYQREWLYDVACLKYADNEFSRPLMKVYLAAECEWGPERAVHNDFEKLLVARADVRVMVYDGTRVRDDDKFTKLEHFVRRCRFTQAGDTYLLAAYSDDRFEYRQINVRIEAIAEAAP